MMRETRSHRGGRHLHHLTSLALFDDHRVTQFSGRALARSGPPPARASAGWGIPLAVPIQQGVGIVREIITGEERKMRIEPVFQGLDELPRVTLCPLPNPPGRDQLPRLLFVDEQVHKRHRLDFPEDAVPFRPDAPGEDRALHRDAICAFRESFETAYRPPRISRPTEATLVSGDGSALRSTAQDVAEILRREGYAVTLVTGNRPGRGLDDIRLLETLWRSELCVFLLGERLSDAHLALAMAHANCIPSVRLQYDKAASNCSPSVSGVIRWHTSDDMLIECGRQLTSYKLGLVQPVDIARSSSATEAARSVGTMKWTVRSDNLWDVQDGLALTRHVYPDHVFIRDEVNRVRAQYKRSLGLERGREASMQICRLLHANLSPSLRGHAATQAGLRTGTADGDTGNPSDPHTNPDRDTSDCDLHRPRLFVRIPP